jgi:hypothetical protein
MEGDMHLLPLVDAALAQSDAEPEWDCFTQGCKQADTIDGLIGCAVKYRAKIKELEAALAQSDAEPVAWQCRPKRLDYQGREHEWSSCAKWQYDDPQSTYEYRALYTAPPRPDASVLIEAETVIKAMVEACEDCDADGVIAIARTYFDRAADRSGK